MKFKCIKRRRIPFEEYFSEVVHSPSSFIRSRTLSHQKTAAAVKTFLSSASGFIELLSHFVAAIFAILGAIPCKREVFCLMSSKDFHSANEIEFTFSCCFSELKLRTAAYYRLVLSSKRIPMFYYKR